MSVVCPARSTGINAVMCQCHCASGGKEHAKLQPRQHWRRLVRQWRRSATVPAGAAAARAVAITVTVLAEPRSSCADRVVPLWL